MRRDTEIEPCATQESLPALVARELSPAAEIEVVRHVAGCEQCRGWLETYQLLDSALEAGATVHPASDEIAAWACSPAGPPPEARRHLEGCALCRHLLTLAGEPQLESAAAAPRGGAPPWRRAALAAAALILLLVPVAIFFGTRQRPSTTDREIDSGRLEGTQLIAAPRSLQVSGVTITSGSEVHFEAGDTVILGDDFVVESEAVLSVRNTQPLTGNRSPGEGS